MNRTYRIVIADDERVMRDYFQNLLPVLGHQVVGASESGQQLVDTCLRLKPDLIITDIKMPDMDGIDAVRQINQTYVVPAVVVSGYDEPSYVERVKETSVLAYLVKPIKQSDLGPTIELVMNRFAQLQALHRETADLRQTLEDRKVVERAKGIVMRRLYLDEAEAFRRLQRLSADQNRKLIEVAHEVLRSEQVFQLMEKK